MSIRDLQNENKSLIIRRLIADAHATINLQPFREFTQFTYRQLADFSPSPLQQAPIVNSKPEKNEQVFDRTNAVSSSQTFSRSLSTRR
jgi:hypothetical protein